MRTTITVILGTIIVLFGVGCHRPAQPMSATQAVVDVSDYDLYVDATLTALRECDFAPRRVDRQLGRIQAGPTTGAQWFEFWRGDSQGAYQVLESSLHTIQREVTVTITPTDEPLESGPAEPTAPPASTEMEMMTPVDEIPPAPAEPESEPEQSMPISGRFLVSVQVDKYRESAPERQVTTASGALAIYSERLPTTEGLRAARGGGFQRVPLGRDALLETYLLSKIINVMPETPPGK
ncbi:MAG: hypothetical protein JXO22_14185 [Phycisphaerae bacterium]|nr:hypothetical protein [Phycisphaerae bacterium]